MLSKIKNIPPLYFIIILLIVFSFANKKKNENPIIVKQAFKMAELQLESISQKPDSTKIPRSIHNDGTMHYVLPEDWTSGFFPGSLWYIYEYTGKQEWKNRALKWTSFLEKVQYQKNTHDLGFMMYCSYGNGYRLTNNPKYKEILIQSSKSLLQRYNPTVGAIKSWDRDQFNKQWQYPVIIDNMMNLELLFWATKATGDSIYYKVARTHAYTTLKNHFRSNNSSYHVVDYDSITGAVLAKNTHQGISDESSWARGQGWGLYGYTMCYRETKEQQFLSQAEKIADYILTHPNLPKDNIPFWDFNAKDIPNAPRDASSSAIIASALLELSTYAVKNNTLYFNAAEKIIENLSTEIYTAKIGTNNSFILKHSTGNYPNGTEIDKPIAYADYYYLEALIRYNTLLNKDKK